MPECHGVNPRIFIISWDVKLTPEITLPLESVVILLYVPAIPVELNSIAFSETITSWDDPIFNTIEPFGKLIFPPPIKPEPATIFIDDPLVTILPVANGKDDNFVPS